MAIGCGNCGREGHLYLHHGKLRCGGCLDADDADSPVERARVLRLKARAQRERAQALRAQLVGLPTDGRRP
jgi:hypothetical protein